MRGSSPGTHLGDLETGLSEADILGDALFQLFGHSASRSSRYGKEEERLVGAAAERLDVAESGGRT